MGRKALAKATETFDKLPPSVTSEAKEAQMIALAEDLAEKQLRDGTAKAMVIAHYLKLGSSKERLEQKLAEKQLKLIEAKTEALESAKRIEELYSNAIAAMRNYGGNRL